jgi:hypothetical protein
MSQQLKRRGVIAAALVAGIAAAKTGQPVRAATPLSVPGTFLVSAPGSSALTLTAISSTEFSIAIDAEASAPNGAAVLGTAHANGTGIFGASGNGEITQFNNVAVGGDNSNVAGIGVFGRALGTGVLGKIPNTSVAANAVAVRADNQSTGAGGIGVYATANTGYGVLGVSNMAGYSGCTGAAYVAGTAAFAGGTSTPGAYAAYFTGPVVVDGDFTVIDPTRKHGAIKHPDGS